LYIGATVPAVLVGFAAKRLGLETATLTFDAVIAVLAIIGFIWIRVSPVQALQT
jgi:hypothetical protein